MKTLPLINHEGKSGGRNGSATRKTRVNFSVKNCDTGAYIALQTAGVNISAREAERKPRAERESIVKDRDERFAVEVLLLKLPPTAPTYRSAPCNKYRETFYSVSQNRHRSLQTRNDYKTADPLRSDCDRCARHAQLSYVYICVCVCLCLFFLTITFVANRL